MKIGVLALQGAFIEHERMLESLGAETFEIRQKKDIEAHMDAIVLPGGESTVMGKLLNDLELMDPIRDMIINGLPAFGTCAGLILLAEKIYNDDVVHIGTMNITARRNAYGRQLGSFHTIREMKGIGQVPMTFIRAPYIEKCGEGAEVLAEVDGNIVAVKYKKQYGLAFHPELDEDDRIHEAFLNSVKKYAKKNSPNTWL
mgnify:CR=1 FL=1